MTLKRIDNVAVIVDDLAAATAFFVELGMEPEGEASVDGGLGEQWVAHQADAAMPPQTRPAARLVHGVGALPRQALVPA